MTRPDTDGFQTEIQMMSPSYVDVIERRWGYIIRSGNKAAFRMGLGQALAFVIGVSFATAALGVVVLPTLFFQGDFNAMRVGAAALFGAIAAYMLWFASRGSHPEMHVNTYRREIREVVANRAGRPTRTRVYPFDNIREFVITPDAGGLAQLAIADPILDEMVCLAEGTPEQLAPLRDRLAQDLL